MQVFISLLIFLLFSCGQEDKSKIHEVSSPGQKSLEPIQLPSSKFLPEWEGREEEPKKPEETQSNKVSKFIGSPCQKDSDCNYESGLCVALSSKQDERKVCTKKCSRFCPDQKGFPGTFCIQTPLSKKIGYCVSRCSSQFFSKNNGCSESFSCQLSSRFNEEKTKRQACLGKWIKDKQIDPTTKTKLSCSNKKATFKEDLSCFLKSFSFSDVDLEKLSLLSLKGALNKTQALELLDKHYKLSQNWIKQELKGPFNNNFSSGHKFPMKGMIVHYTANQTLKNTVSYFMKKGAHASSHFVSDWLEDGLTIQLFSHKNRTWHAGSKYNSTHFGFDFVNTGYLKLKSGNYVDYAGRKYFAKVNGFGNKPITIKDGIPGVSSKYSRIKTWMPYSFRQLLSMVTLGRALHMVYQLEKDKIQRHGDVSNSRVDPGPALPHSKLIETLLNSDDCTDGSSWLSEYYNDPDWIIKNKNAR